MQFKINNINIKISFSFLAVLLIFLVADNLKIYISTFLAASLHEAVHIIFIYLFKMKIKSIKISAFGGNIQRFSGQNGSYINEFFIHSSAPLFNIILGLIIYIINKRTDIFCISNLIIGIFNLLPFYNFDGGKSLYFLLAYKFNETITNCIITISSVIVTVFVSFLSIYFYIFNENFTLFSISLYMILTLLFKK